MSQIIDWIAMFPHAAMEIMGKIYDGFQRKNRIYDFCVACAWCGLASILLEILY